MTRGIIYAITDDMVLSSTQFNGDMYPNGFGLEVITMLQNSKKLIEVKKGIENFNKKHHQYTDKILFLKKRSLYFTGVKSYKTIDKHNTNVIVEVGDNAIDMSDEACSFGWNDWNFIKNLSSQTITLIVKNRKNTKKHIELKPNQQVATNYNYYERHYKTTKQCEKLIQKENKEYEKKIKKQLEEKEKHEKKQASKITF